METNKKIYAMQRMGIALARAVSAKTVAGKDRGARWAAAWGQIAGIPGNPRHGRTLNLGKQARKRLYALQALTRDSDGDEVFVGLTVSESVFYLEKSLYPQGELTGSDRWFYLQIRDRHTKARIRLMNDEVRAYLAERYSRERD